MTVPNLWWRYGIAAALVVCLITTSHIFHGLAIDGGVEGARAINLAGRQRMLSQQIYFMTETRVLRGDTAPDNRLVSQLAEFERNHDALLNGGALGLTADHAPSRAALYLAEHDGASADERLRQLVLDASTVLGGGPLASTAWARMEAEGPMRLLHRLDEIVRAIEAGERARVQRVKRIASLSYALALLLLVVEAIFIFRPAQNATNRAFRALKQSAREAASARDEALAALSVRSVFLDHISHQIRTPMNGIIGMLQALEHAQDEAERQTFLAVIKTSAETLLDLLSHILSLSEYGTQTQPRVRRAIEIEPFVRGVMEDLSATELANTARLTVHNDVPHDRLFFDGDAARYLIRMFLRHNEHLANAGHVEFTIDHNETEQWIRFRLCGAPDHDDDEAFSPPTIQRAVPAGTEDAAGLSLMQEAVSRLGGALYFYERGGALAGLFLEFPLYREPLDAVSSPTMEEDSAAAYGRMAAG